MEVLNKHIFEADSIKTFIMKLKVELSIDLICVINGSDPLYFDDFETQKQQTYAKSYGEACNNTFVWLSGLTIEKMSRLVAYLDII